MFSTGMLGYTPTTFPGPIEGDVQYTAPELLNPSAFGLKKSKPTEKSDIYSFGVITYQASIEYCTSALEIEGGIQVVTRHEPFPETKGGQIICSIVTGELQTRPLGPSVWVSDEAWNFISQCWSLSWVDRPDANFAVNALNNAADAIEAQKLDATLEIGLPAFLHVCKTGSGKPLERKRAQEFADKLDAVRIPRESGYLVFLPWI